jgi:hypothetical protein
MTKIDVLTKYLLLMADQVDRLLVDERPGSEPWIGDQLRRDLASLREMAKPIASVPISFDLSSGLFQGITGTQYTLWTKAYPAVNIEQELAAAGAWLMANPKKAPRSNYSRFLAGWMSRTQQKGGTRGFVLSQPVDKAESWAKS